MAHDYMLTGLVQTLMAFGWRAVSGPCLYAYWLGADPDGVSLADR